MKTPSFPLRLGIGAVLLLAVAIWATTSGTWRAFSEASGIGNPDAQITAVDVPSVPVPQPPSSGAYDDALTTARALTTASPSRAAAYSRDQFGQRWADVDRNGCDTRNDILARDLAEPTFKPGTRSCVVTAGVLPDPYTGTQIQFRKGNTTSSAVQIDHLVPLSLAWKHGASNWDAATRTRFANDPANLLAVDGPTNTAKSDLGPSQWMPPNKAYWCQYAADFTRVAHTYGLSVTKADRDALVDVLSGC